MSTVGQLRIGAAHGTPEWHDQRRGMVTASVVGRLITVGHLSAIDYDCPACDAPAENPCRSKVKRNGETAVPIKTLHPERTAVADALADESPLVLTVADNDYSRALAATLVAERITGYTDPTYMNADMWRGIDDEPRAIADYADHYAPVTASGFMMRDIQGFEIGYSPDGLVGDDGLIECKSRRQKKQLQTVLSDTVPAENMAQLQAGLLVSGREWIDYVSYCGGMPLYVKRVLPDEQWFEVITEAVTLFEQTADEMVAAYTQATNGLPVSERAIELEIVI
jgi:hypothetical protein